MTAARTAGQSAAGTAALSAGPACCAAHGTRRRGHLTAGGRRAGLRVLRLAVRLTPPMIAQAAPIPGRGRYMIQYLTL